MIFHIEEASNGWILHIVEQGSKGVNVREVFYDIEKLFQRIREEIA